MCLYVPDFRPRYEFPDRALYEGAQGPAEYFTVQGDCSVSTQVNLGRLLTEVSVRHPHLAARKAESVTGQVDHFSPIYSVMLARAFAPRELNFLGLSC